MRRTAWVLLVLFVFAIPWEYSLDAGAPFGNVARVLGILTLLAAVPAVLLEGRFRRTGAIHWLMIAFYLWQCCTLLWTLVPQLTLFHLRAYAQEMMVVWLIWEFVDSKLDLRMLLRAWLAGSGVLALLTMAGFVSAVRLASEQVRFAAIGQDPNDVARLLVFGFPIAMLVAAGTCTRRERALALLYFPLGSAAILVTASRSGILLELVALVGCVLAGLRSHARATLIAAGSVVFAAGVIFVVAPSGTLDRLGSAAQARQYGDLNQRVNIWSAGWEAFEDAPIIGRGAGAFVSAAKLAPEDTAHNTPLALLVESGLCGLSLFLAIFLVAARAIWRSEPTVRLGLSILMLLWVISSLTGTLWENRITWLMIGVAAASGGTAGESNLRMSDRDQVPVSDSAEFNAPSLA
ncbi:O-antigen ligase family protein [Occallatibacter savannae]|uniref:O-antigen ligase family protein n=1 Tax=Occallatibacter savannae TaxID=1002691 RepID=UPI000D68D04A|nr:O-antigen ligase family protein [Occallatibacter savannae]